MKFAHIALAVGVLTAGSAASAQAPSPAPDAPVVAYVQRDVRPMLADMSPGANAAGTAEAALGAVGVLAMLATSGPLWKAGEKILVDNQIGNPGDEVAREIARAFADARGYRLADTPVQTDKADLLDFEAKALPADLGNAGFIVEADRPRMVMSSRENGGVRRWLLTYGNNIRIWDVAKHAMVARGRCMVFPRVGPDSPTREALMADGAAGLKQQIKANVEVCVRQLKARLKFNGGG